MIDEIMSQTGDGIVVTAGDSTEALFRLKPRGKIVVCQ